MSDEIELKLATSRRGLQQARTLPWLTKLTGQPTQEQELTSVYFDTDDFALREQGVSLRVRKVGGQRRQTIKANSGALIARQEWESEIDSDEPELDVARSTEVAPVFTPELTKRLKPVFETRIVRATSPLSFAGAEIELAFDQGQVATVDATADIAEIEIELKRGDPRQVTWLAKKFARSLPVALSVRSKAEIGYALLDGGLQAPLFAEPIALARKGTAEEAFASIGLACLRQIAANESAVRHGDPEGIHQMRVGLRRLRAALSLFKEMLHEDEVRGLKRELKWLTEELAPARDYDVFVRQTLAPYLAKHSDWPELETLHHELDAKRRAGFASARTAVESERFRRVVLGCVFWLFEGKWRDDSDALKQGLRRRRARAFAQEELGRRIRKITKRASKLERLDWRKRHKVRIAVKKVRYGREFFASLRDDGGKDNRKLDRALKRLQSALGHLNDMRVHLELARDFTRTGKAAQRAFAVGSLIGLEQAGAADVLADAVAAGKRVRRAI